MAHVAPRQIARGCWINAKVPVVPGTVKVTPVLATPPTVTTTSPVVASLGTEATMFVSLQSVGVAKVPLNVTVFVPCVASKCVPAIVTAVPAVPDVGVKVVMLGGGGVTVKLTPVLATPPTVTTTSPVVASLGIGALILVVLQLVGVARVPLNVTALAPCVAPKFVPAIVTAVPTGPDGGVSVAMLGGGGKVTAKLTPVLAAPLTVTTTFPVVAPLGTGALILVVLQLVGVATVPLNVTVLAPCVPPKFFPPIVTAAPTGPDVGVSMVMLGGAVTVNLTPVLDSPLTLTTTSPVVALLGTSALILVGLQLVGVARVPLNLTVLVPCVAPKFVPSILTAVPTGPEVGVRVVILGRRVTVKLRPALGTPPTVTTTFPVVAKLGTVTLILVALQLVGVATVPLNLTVLVPCVAPKSFPSILTAVPTGPEVGVRLVIAGITAGTCASPTGPQNCITRMASTPMSAGRRTSRRLRRSGNFISVHSLFGLPSSLDNVGVCD